MQQTITSTNTAPTSPSGAVADSERGRAGTGTSGRLGPEVRRAASAEARLVAETVAAAFADDPVARWMVPDDERYARGAVRGFMAFLDVIFLPHGETYLTSEGSGAALWIPPAGEEPSAVAQARMIARLLPAYGAQGVRRALRLLAAQDAHHPQEPHWYLGVVGTRPERQGEGIGSALIEAVTRRADAEGAPSYLEATTERSALLYERHGFEHRGPFTVAGGGPTLWPMWREPR